MKGEPLRSGCQPEVMSSSWFVFASGTENLSWKQRELKEKSGMPPRFGAEQKTGLPLPRLQGGFREEM